MADDGFYSRLHAAEDAGLNQEWALKVAYLECTLDEALGVMDSDSEVACMLQQQTAMEDIESDPNSVEPF